MLESEEQAILVSWYREKYPEHSQALRVSLLGMHRGKPREAAIRTRKAYSQGAVEGEADIAIMLPRGGYGSLVIEYKRDEDIKGATDMQIRYIEYHNRVGNCACVAKGVDMAKAAISQYMALDK